MDTHDPGRLTLSRARRPRAGAPRAKASRHGHAIMVATTLLGTLLLLARPVSGAVPIPDPSLPVPLPSLPLTPVPTLQLPTPSPPPLPTLPPPTLPPTPTLPVPTPTISIPPASLPIATPTPPTRSPSPSASGAGGGPISSVIPSGPAGSLVAASGGLGEAASAGPREVVSTAPDGARSPFETFVLPGLIVGVPAMLLLGILAAQVAIGAAWLPVIRRWLNRRV